MATRRQLSKTRGGGGNSVIAAIGSSVSLSSARPRSALSRPGNSHTNNIPKSHEERFQPNSLEASSSSTSITQSHTRSQPTNTTGLDANIKVVIRCRRRSDREIHDNSPIIVSSNGPRGQEITIETAAPSSNLGVVTFPPTKTYPFDLVFGPEADQAMVYQDVVHPMLDEVLKGYNCTLFAYGQTGTGKTYTMQGDVNLTPLGNPSSQAGMIPRVLFKLFNHLESSGADYSVKISYIELYNEELRDLLAPDFVAPTGSAQPMSFGLQKESQTCLKLFDDATKKGVFIQGLEEAYVKDFSDAIALLNKGSQRRQIAATKFNDHSSRSHSVFTMTIHCKETSSLGDDLLKIGKLNLVDLAGSENIGRSGAENKRAREAGMINQSLLTLGRVINALVDGGSHVPYRESKLTRLLQDSLGGHTKTCIIATISPARSNLEETLSTLDYAIRAKSIRNKPEINQRMTRNALLRDYVVEIERLKADVLAAREKNGIYFSEDTWNQLSAEHELRQTEVEEAKKHVELIESQMTAVREEFEQSVALLLRTNADLKQTKDTLEEKTAALENCEKELGSVNVALEEECLVRDAYATTENSLDTVANNLRKVANESTNDINGLFSKLERQTRILNSNASSVLAQCKDVDAEILKLRGVMEIFNEEHSRHLDEVYGQVELFRQKSAKDTLNSLRIFDEFVVRMKEENDSMQIHGKISDECMAFIQAAVTELYSNIMSELSIRTKKIAEVFESNSVKVLESSTKGQKLVENLVKSSNNSLNTIRRQVESYIGNEREARDVYCESLRRTAELEISRLNAHNTKLESLIEEEKAKSQLARDDLIRNVSSLLTDFCEKKDGDLRDTILIAKQTNDAVIKSMKSIEDEHNVAAQGTISREISWHDSLQHKIDESNINNENGIRAIDSAHRSTASSLKRIRDSAASSLNDYAEYIHGQIRNMNDVCAEGFERAANVKKVRTNHAKSFASDLQLASGEMQQGLRSSSQLSEEHVKFIISSNGVLKERLRDFSFRANTHVTTLSKQSQKIRDEGTREDIQTGQTPRKRTWEYVDNWKLTRSREEILTDYRQQRNIQSSMESQLELCPRSGNEREISSPEGTVFHHSNNVTELQRCSPRSDLMGENIPPNPLLSASPKSTELDVAERLKDFPSKTLTERSTNIANIRRSRRMR